jgi:hypothetical protein
MPDITLIIIYQGQNVNKLSVIDSEQTSVLRERCFIKKVSAFLKTPLSFIPTFHNSGFCVRVIQDTFTSCSTGLLQKD